MKPSDFNAFAISTLSFEAGITTLSCLARDAFRIRVNISPTGSLTGMFQLSSGCPRHPYAWSVDAFRAHPGGSPSLNGWTYQDDLVRPVTSPASARLRRQM